MILIFCSYCRLKIFMAVVSDSLCSCLISPCPPALLLLNACVELTGRIGLKTEKWNVCSQLESLTFLPSSVEGCDPCRLVWIGLGGFLSAATLTFALACSWPALTLNQFVMLALLRARHCSKSYVSRDNIRSKSIPEGLCRKHAYKFWECDP